jgi:cell division protein ZapA
MSAKKHSVHVTILGEDYTIRSDASPEHTRAVASYLDEAIRKVMNSRMTIEPTKAAILAGMQITNELFEARSIADEVTAGLQSLTTEVRRLLPLNKRPG